ncbi:MAG: chorismate synthase [Candidatus Altiarchaeota archaeon]|nr:chorismate synthase [Candidatus Altiarchaeota archaeon]
MNSYGRFFRVTSFGESHGYGIGCVVDGCPSGLALSREDIQVELDKRRPGQSPTASERREEDRVEVLSGVFEGRTTGTPISLLIRNVDVDSSKYEALKNTPRPGHADYTWRMKFGWVDLRGGGRASGRETASRVAAGAVAKKLLSKYGIEVVAYSKEIAGIKAEGFKADNPGKLRKLIDSSPVKAPARGEDMLEAILAAKQEKDSVGGIIEAVAFGVPPGLGEPVFDKLDADIAKALLSIPSVKGVEFGAGFGFSRMRGSEANDAFILRDGRVQTETNRCGGFLGGISNGMQLVVRAAVKPTSSIGKKQASVDLEKMKETVLEVGGRHDPCIVPRAVPVVEAMLSIVLADHSLVSGLIPRKL